MIIQYQDPNIFDLFEGDKLFMLQDSEVHVVSDIRKSLNIVYFEDGFGIGGDKNYKLHGVILFRKVAIDI